MGGVPVTSIGLVTQVVAQLFNYYRRIQNDHPTMICDGNIMNESSWDFIITCGLTAITLALQLSISAMATHSGPLKLTSLF
jgi:hypothetical protein